MQGSRDESTQVVQVLKSSLRVGAATGFTGVVFGALGGVISSTHPFLFSVISGAQWFTLGSTFWFTRSILLQEMNHDTTRKPFASSVAGTVSGTVTAVLFRGRANILPGGLVGCAVGFGGQHALDAWRRSNLKSASEDSSKPEPLLVRISRSRWSPMQFMSNEDYHDKLEKKILHVDAELAIINEDLAVLQEAKAAENTNDQK